MSQPNAADNPVIAFLGRLRASVTNPLGQAVRYFHDIARIEGL